MKKKNKKALIFGITGQDGAYLSEFLIKKGYSVHGVKRRSSSFNTGRIDHIYQDPHSSNRNFILHHGDLTDSSSILRIIQQVQPFSYLYNPLQSLALRHALFCDGDSFYDDFDPYCYSEFP